MKPKTIIILLLILLVIVVIIQNSEMITLKLFFWKIIMSRIIFIVGLLLFGSILGFLVAKMTQKS